MALEQPPGADDVVPVDLPVPYVVAVVGIALDATGAVYVVNEVGTLTKYAIQG